MICTKDWEIHIVEKNVDDQYIPGEKFTKVIKEIDDNIDKNKHAETGEEVLKKIFNDISADDLHLKIFLNGCFS